MFNGDNDANLTGAASSRTRFRLFGRVGHRRLAPEHQIDGLTEGVEYVATIYSVGFDNPGPAIRWATFSVGDDRLTVNQDQFGNNAGIRLSYRYTADASGSVTLNYAPLNPANVSFHTCGQQPRSGQPQCGAENHRPAENVVVAANQPATFMVTATGIPAPTYQWRFKGSDIAGATETSYTISAVTAANVGAYDVVVKNSMGTVTSSAATLTVGIALANPSFEEDIFSTWPGYVSDNWDITGWTALGGHGLNPVQDGRSPFADNGMIPHGAQVAFMQQNGALSQTVTGLTTGAVTICTTTKTPAQNNRAVHGSATRQRLPGVRSLGPVVRGGVYYKLRRRLRGRASELLLSFIRGSRRDHRADRQCAIVEIAGHGAVRTQPCPRPCPWCTAAPSSIAPPGSINVRGEEMPEPAPLTFEQRAEGTGWFVSQTAPARSQRGPGLPLKPIPDYSAGLTNARTSPRTGGRSALHTDRERM